MHAPTNHIQLYSGDTVHLCYKIAESRELVACG